MLAWLQFNHWPIRLHVQVGPALLLLVLLASTMAGATALRRLHETHDLVGRSQQALALSAELARLVVDMETGIRGFALTRDDVYLFPYVQARARLSDTLDELRHLDQDVPEQQARLATVARLTDEWIALVGEEMVRRVRAGGDVPGLVASGEGMRRTQAIRAELQAFDSYEREQLDKRASSDLNARSMANAVFFWSLATGGLAFVIAAYVGQQISRPVRQFALAVHRIGSGDFNVRIRVSGTNELARTAQAINVMAGALHGASTELLEQNRTLHEKAASEERARSELRAILDAAQSGLVFIDASGRVAWANHSFEQLMGGELRSLVGFSTQDLHPLLGACFEEAEPLLDAMEGPLPSPGPSAPRFVRLLGPEPRELHVVTSPVRSSSGQALGRLVVLRDVTHEREVDRMKSEFVSLVSHELRTPLTSISGYVDLLLHGEAGSISPSQREFLEIVRNNAERLVALINDILDITRIEAGRVELRAVPLDVSHLVGEVTATLRPLLDQKQQRLTIDLPAYLPAALGDHGRLVQVLTNLVSNAHKYTPRGGSITVSASADDRFLTIAVRDTGVGLSLEDQQRLFTRFFRARHPDTQDVGGTGLGLAITRTLVEMHGGTIQVDSTPGKGSTFAFTVPIASHAQRATGEPTAGGAPVGLGGTVLVVEDEPDIARLLTTYLERGGFRALVASSGEEALRLVREQRPDLITLDILLPQADGFTVLEWLQRDPESASIPVVLLSILPDDGSGTRSGAADYLAKPVQESVLLDRLRRLLVGQRARSVLVVDDDADARGLIAGHLRRAGLTVLEAADGAQAVDTVLRERPGLVLMDVKMPTQTGVDALRRLREHADTRHVPVVLMTASPGSIEESRAAIEHLAAALVPKPVTAGDVASAVALGLKNTRFD